MILCCIVMTACLLFQFAGLFPDYGGLLDWYFDDLHATYRAIDLFKWIFLWSSLLITFGFPLSLYFYRRVSLVHDSSLTSIFTMCLNVSIQYVPRRVNARKVVRGPQVQQKGHRRNPSRTSERQSDGPSDRNSMASASNEDVEYEV